MGQIVIPDVDDRLIRQLEQHAAAMCMTLGESLRNTLVEMAGQPWVQKPTQPGPLAGALQHRAQGAIVLEEAQEPNGTQLARLARRDADADMVAQFGDPVEWQRAQRQDRPLSGREV
ncbi:MAG: hypothetical protein HQL87_13805 [Magnetococcales bacterium]|nr:hypothetical protein [Magnetococcales bacterium]